MSRNAGHGREFPIIFPQCSIFACNSARNNIACAQEKKTRPTIRVAEGDFFMRIGLYPGTFDPVTLGHLDIIRRSATLVDRLVIGVAINRDKGPLFSLEERVAMIEDATREVAQEAGIEIVAHPFENLLIHCARDVGAQVIIRGLRAVTDFEYEYQMVGMNRAMDASIETVFLMAEARHQAIASKLVKEIARLNGDISNFVTPEVAEKLLEKLNR
jgi:pantetheine-phosphate adenylyltransferase